MPHLRDPTELELVGWVRCTLLGLKSYRAFHGFLKRLGFVMPSVSVPTTTAVFPELLSSINLMFIAPTMPASKQPSISGAVRHVRA